MTAVAFAFDQGEPLSRVELSKRGKAAAALLEIKPRTAYATAFAVHASGLFVTTEHVVRELGEGQTLPLTLDPGLKSQRTRKAAVVRREGTFLYDLDTDPDERTPEPAGVDAFVESCARDGVPAPAIADATAHLRRWEALHGRSGAAPGSVRVPEGTASSASV